MGIIHVGCARAHKTPPSVHYLVHMEEFFGDLLCSRLFISFVRWMDCFNCIQTHQLLKTEHRVYTFENASVAFTRCFVEFG